MKVYLRRIRLNSGGYDRTGYYYGHGAPLYEYESADSAYVGELRAYDREDAKERVRKELLMKQAIDPAEVKFYR